MKGKVVFDALLHDVDFPRPSSKCLTVGDAARNQIGIHHTNPRRVRALWRKHRKTLPRGAGGGAGSLVGPARHNATGLIVDPAQPVQCVVSREGDPGDVWHLSDHRYLDSFRRYTDYVLHYLLGQPS